MEKRGKNVGIVGVLSNKSLLSKAVSTPEHHRCTGKSADSTKEAARDAEIRLSSPCSSFFFSFQKHIKNNK